MIYGSQSLWKPNSIKLAYLEWGFLTTTPKFTTRYFSLSLGILKCHKTVFRDILQEPSETRTPRFSREKLREKLERKSRMRMLEAKKSQGSKKIKIFQEVILRVNSAQSSIFSFGKIPLRKSLLTIRCSFYPQKHRISQNKSIKDAKILWASECAWLTELANAIVTVAEHLQRSLMKATRPGSQLVILICISALQLNLKGQAATFSSAPHGIFLHSLYYEHCGARSRQQVSNKFQ